MNLLTLLLVLVLVRVNHALNDGHRDQQQQTLMVDDDDTVQRAYDELTNVARKLGATESVRILNQHRNKGKKAMDDAVVAAAGAGVNLYESFRDGSWGVRVGALLTFTGAVMTPGVPVIGPLVRMVGGIITSFVRSREPGREPPITANQLSIEVSRIIEMHLSEMEAGSALGQAFRNLNHAEVALIGWLKALQDVTSLPPGRTRRQERERQRKIQAVVDGIIGPAGQQPSAVSRSLLDVIHDMTRAAENLDRLVANAQRHFNGNRRNAQAQAGLWQYMCTKEDHASISNPCLGNLFNRGWTDDRVRLHEDRVEWPLRAFSSLTQSIRLEMRANPMIAACMRAELIGRRGACARHGNQRVSFDGNCRDRADVAQSCTVYWNELQSKNNGNTNVDQFRALIQMFKLTVLTHVATYFMIEPYLDDPLRFFRPGEFHIAVLSSTADRWGIERGCKAGDDRLFTNQWARPSASEDWQTCFTGSIRNTPMGDARITNRPNEVNWFDFNTINFQAALL